MNYANLQVYSLWDQIWPAPSWWKRQAMHYGRIFIMTVIHYCKFDCNLKIAGRLRNLLLDPNT